jgi:uncharacterized protein YndB with AHSA1/START domain
MKENKIKIIINRPVGDVFEFTTNPQNTHLWIPSIKEEICDEYPPKVNILYKNRGNSPEWTTYKVVEFERNKIFTLTDQNGNYSVRYTYRKINENVTEMEYFEWVKEGELENPFTEEIFKNLKRIMESEN